MRLIPKYTWNKGLKSFDISRRKFIDQPWAPGITLIVCVIVAMLLANLPLTKELYHSILETDITILVKSPINPETGVSDIEFTFPENMNIEKFINDILMVIFFFAVGLEIKREVVYGELSSFKKAILPVIAAFGGMAFPALFYTLFNHGTLASSGWGISTATDIAFAIGILSILGNKVPVALKVFLAALAIADDLGAILVVAIFYGGSINFPLLAIAVLLVILVYVQNRLGEKRMFCYLVPAFVIWILFYYSGIHSTMSGVVMALLIPSGPRYNRAYFDRKRKQYQNRIAKLDHLKDTDETSFPNGPQRHCLRRLSVISNGSIGMSYRLEHALNPYINFLIMPIFALANAGVEIPDFASLNIFQYDSQLGSVGMGVFCGLLLGKPIGITLASFITIKAKIGAMPSNSSWKMLFAVACLGGIGFTMSIFVDTLSFGENSPEICAMMRNTGKIAVLLGSLGAGILGCVLINAFSKLEKAK